MLTSYSKKRYAYVKENFEKLYPSVNQKEFGTSTFGEKMLYITAAIVNIYCVYSTIIIMSSYSLICNMITMLIAYVVGDIASGFVHWLPDSYDVHPFLLETPVLSTFGNILQESFDGFRMHHIKPYTIVTHTIFNTCGSTFIFVAFVQMFLRLIIPCNYFIGLVGIISTLNIFSNEFHKISHMSNDQMMFIQKIINKTNIFLTKDRHRSHHIFESEVQGYTMLSGLFNPLLDRPDVRFWERLETIMFFLFGIKSFRMINNELND